VRLKVYQYSENGKRYVKVLVNDVDEFTTATSNALATNDAVKMVYGVEDQGHCS
jgi:hypothetical protein